MIKRIKYSNRDITILPYTTEIERDLLLYTSDDYNIDTVLKLLESKIQSNIDIYTLSYDEKFNLILQLKNISVGEMFSFKCTCNGCKKQYEYDAFFIDTIDETNSIIPSFKDYNIIEAFSSNYQDYVKDIDIDELDINEYDELIEHINKYKSSFNFQCESVCPYCAVKGFINLTEENLIKNLSDDELGNFYKVISGMVYFGNYTLTDINKMYPFERSIYLGLLNQQKTEQNKANS